MRYVAIGDSFTEGVGDELPDGSVRGWADLVAAGLAEATGGVVHYANLAVRGRLLAPIVTEQLDAALALTPPPTMLTLNGGGNDMMRPGHRGGMRLIALTEGAVRRCLDAGVQVVLISGADASSRLPLGQLMRRRATLVTDRLAELATRYRGDGLVFVDGFHDPELPKAGYWAPDRLHLNAAGHHRMAALVLAALGHPQAARAMDPVAPASRSLRAEARYYREYVLPWIDRRVHGRSSGDGRAGKYLDWTPIVPQGPAVDPAGGRQAGEGARTYSKREGSPAPARTTSG